MTNRISDEKSWEHAREIHNTVLDLALDDCEAEARLLERRLRKDPNVSNEERGNLVCDCFVDYADALDLPNPTRQFIARFPEYS